MPNPGDKEIGTRIPAKQACAFAKLSTAHCVIENPMTLNNSAKTHSYQ